MLTEDQLKAYCRSNGGDFSLSLTSLEESIMDSDFVIANLETPITKQFSGLTSEPYSFNSPIAFAQAVKNAGIHLVTTANNHCLDRGESGLIETIHCLEQVGLWHVGTHLVYEDTFIIEEINGIKVGILAYTYGTNAFANQNYLSKSKYYMVDLLQNQELSNPLIRQFYLNGTLPFRFMRSILSKLKIGQYHIPIYERREKDRKTKKKYLQAIADCRKAGVDYIIACLHNGGQYNDEPLEYTKEMCELSKQAGVDAVIANHEHIIHRICLDENNKICAYCLGNLLSSSGVTIEPFDKLVEYSIGINIDLCLKEDINHLQVEYSFQIYCSVLNDKGFIVCKPLFQLINEYDRNEKKKN